MLVRDAVQVGLADAMSDQRFGGAVRPPDASKVARSSGPTRPRGGAPRLFAGEVMSVGREIYSGSFR
jgi:hypothetical protein